MTDAASWPDGVARRVLAQCPSTNEEALRLAAAREPPTWIMALQQTRGRGRRGRVWAMPPGNLAASLALRPAVPAPEAALYSFVAALAVRDALAAFLPPHAGLSLKWPNDVLLNGGKVAGILLESSGSGDGGIAALAIGIGINLAAVPPASALGPEALRPVSVAGETGLTIAPEDCLAALAAAFDRHQRRLHEQGFAPIREHWLGAAARLGQVITARTGTAERRGRFETIDRSGALVLVTDSGREVIPAADIFF